MPNFENTKKQSAHKKKVDFYHNKTVKEYQVDNNNQNNQNLATH